jgi:hypothetical protein
MIRLFVIIISLIATTTWGSVGEITVTTGPGEIKRQSEKFEGSAGTELEMQDAITTQNGAWQLEFLDDTRVDVTEHSRMVIDEFIYDPQTKTGALSMKATLGAVRYASGQIAKNSRQRVNIRTPSATIAVRGTDFMMIVDEIGGSMITLLPSCDTSGACVVGEISVESEVGQVIMNQAYETTVVASPYSKPANPLVIQMPDDLLRAMLIVRRKQPYDEETARIQPRTDVLDIDFLAFDELDSDPLVESIKRIWLTDLDNTTYLKTVWTDLLEEQLRELLAKWIDELGTQQVELFETKTMGMDPDTGIVYDEDPPDFVVERTEQDLHHFRLRLDDGGGYTIDMHQEYFSEYGYRVGVGGYSNITINQQSQ